MSKFGANIFWIVTTSNYLRLPSSAFFAKFNIFKVNNFVLPKLRSLAQIEWKEQTYHCFTKYGSKIKECGWKKLEKKKKKIKNLNSP